MTAVRNFLLVDDDPIFLAVAESVVLSLGDHHVVTASDGDEAISILREAAPAIDTIVLDLNMPRLDGLAFMRKAGEAGFAGQIIISSGESEAILRSAQRMAELIGVHVIGTLRKPLTAKTIAELLASAAAASRAKTDAPKAAPGMQALAGSTLIPYYQPQYEIETGRIVGFEALIRVVAADGAVFGPGRLFGSIEEPSDLISVSMLIVRKVIADIVDWRDAGLGSRISINIDATVLEHPDVAPALIQLARENAIRPDGVCFELTETALPTNLGRLIEILTRLRMAGFDISLDDYGTGSSNFELLRLCPFNELKIDTTILQAAGADPMARRFMEVTCAMAKDLDMRVVGEGVETLEQLDLAAVSGVHFAQGFLFSKAVPASKVRMLMAKQAMTSMEPTEIQPISRTNFARRK